MKTRLILFLITSFSLLSGCDLRAQKDSPPTFPITSVFRNELGESIPYALLKLNGSDVRRKLPLVVFLHGAGERGNDIAPLASHTMDLFTGLDSPCLLLIPQCPLGKKWVEVDWHAKHHNFPKDISIPLGLVSSLIDSLQKVPTLQVDLNRIYLTGLSMGGIGTWDLAAREPDRFASIMPVCGAADTSTVGLIEHIPSRHFHGALDRVIYPSRSREMDRRYAISKYPKRHTYIEYPKVGHDAWLHAYSDPESWNWLFSQKRLSR